MAKYFGDFGKSDLNPVRDADRGVAESKANVVKALQIDGPDSERSRAAIDDYDVSWAELLNSTANFMTDLAERSTRGDYKLPKNIFKSLSDTLSRASFSSNDSDLTVLINESNSEASLPATTFLVDINQFNELKSEIEKYSDTTARQLAYISNDCEALIQGLRKAGGSLTSKDIAQIRSIHSSLTQLSEHLYMNSTALEELRSNANRNFFYLESDISNLESGISNLESGISNLKFRQGLTLVLLLGLIGGVAYAGVELDRLIKTVLAIDNQSQKGCYLFTKDAVPVKLDCSDWYSESPNNKFYCKCGTLTDTKIQPDCSKLPKEECNSPYCLGKACGGKSADSSITQCRNTYQCTSANRDDPNFINYQYSDNVPLQPLIPYTIVNKVTYDYYNNNMNNNSNKTLMYISIGIGVVALLILIFFTVKYYIKNKKY
jgi:hypothetical protein